MSKFSQQYSSKRVAYLIKFGTVLIRIIMHLAAKFLDNPSIFYLEICLCPMHSILIRQREKNESK